jgi:hypothetical protein
MPVLETKGAISAQGFGLTLQQGEVNYIEDVFNTWVYTGTGANLTINNGLDLAGKGGLVWNKSRSNSYSHSLIDTARGAGIPIFSNAISAQQTSGYTNSLTGFTSTGFTLGSDSQGLVNNNGFTYVAWAFREQPKFFDIVTYTGNGANNRVIPHNLGSVPGCIITKRLSDEANWGIYHRSLGLQSYILLNTAAAAVSTTQGTDIASVSATDYVLYPPNRDVGYTANESGQTYVAYLFAHNAGGFGLTGTDNVITCGSFTTNGAAQFSVNLGWQPQWVLFKPASATGNWKLADTMRGLYGFDSNGRNLYPNTADAEDGNANMVITPTGFRSNFQLPADATYIYIAIRNGPMKVPTTGTSVFVPIAQTTVENTQENIGFNFDLAMTAFRAGSTDNFIFEDRIRRLSRASADSSTRRLRSSKTTAEQSGNATWFYSQGNRAGEGAYGAGSSLIGYLFGRAPSFFDIVPYTGNSDIQTINHNLRVAPEMMILKASNASSTNWYVYHTAIGPLFYYALNSASLYGGPATRIWNGANPTATTFSVGNESDINSDGTAVIAYLFATCPGVSRVGSFTGTGATQVINCGFTSGARFVMVKRFDTSTGPSGNWMVWDSARGIVAGNDPYMWFNDPTDPEVTNTDWVDTAATGFELSNAGGNLANISGATYIFLAIA